MNNYELAQKFAKIVHHGQKYGTHSYDYHLQQVEMVLQRFGFTDEKLIISAWLHDVIEDTKINYDKIKYGFGGEVADIVYSVTNEMGRNRKERYAKTYPKIRDNRDGLIVKLADRIANIEFSKGMNTGFADMYQREWEVFKRELKSETEVDPRVNKMWEYLISLFEGVENEQ